MIAALYAALTIALAPISFGPVQFRVAEALTLLPFFMPEAIPGLFIGCLLANFTGGFGIIDIVFGSAATLLAAWLTYEMPNMWLAAIPPVIVNCPDCRRLPCFHHRNPFASLDAVYRCKRGGYMFWPWYTVVQTDCKPYKSF